MNEGYISRLAMLAAVTWAAVGVTMLAGWAVAITAPDRWLIGIMLAESACALSAAAAVFSIRRYATRICRLIRNVNGLESEGSSSLRGLP